MTNDYRALCAELVDAIGSLVGGVKCGHYQQQDMWKCREIFDRAHAALAQPEPEPVAPTDEEIFAEATKFLYFSFAHMGDPNKWDGTDADLLDFARAVLARWGAPAIAAELEAQ
jgi:hypothetical protein